VTTEAGYWLRDEALDEVRSRPRMHFDALCPAERAQALRRMAAEGWSVCGIASASGLAIEQVERVLAEGNLSCS
jgi:hypothetical protein